MNSKSSILFIVLLVGLQVDFCVTVDNSTPVSIPLSVMESGIEDVEKFATVIVFYIQIETMSNEAFNVTVAPTGCCLDIAPKDSDCGGIMELRPPVDIAMGSSQLGRAQFLFRNLYARYRKGNCTFSIYSKGPNPWTFVHTIQFNTYPRMYDNELRSTCPGVDQDPDRFCSPADCAIKYHGKRNYYRNSTMKCEKVVECDTRGSDGVSIVAYYDWENNKCHPLNYVLDDNVEIEEKDVVIPAELDPSQNTIFPDFEPNQIKRLMDSGKYILKCNRGIQKGVICECDEGWMSSGVHESSLLDFHWCDTKMVDKATIQRQPRKLSKPLEISLLSLMNVLLFGLWLYLAYKVLYRTFVIKEDKKDGGYTLLKQHKSHK